MIWLHVLIQLVRHHHLQRVLQSHGAEPQEDYGQRWRGGGKSQDSLEVLIDAEVERQHPGDDPVADPGLVCGDDLNDDKDDAALAQELGAQILADPVEPMRDSQIPLSQPVGLDELGNQPDDVAEQPVDEPIYLEPFIEKEEGGQTVESESQITPTELEETPPSFNQPAAIVEIIESQDPAPVEPPMPSTESSPAPSDNHLNSVREKIAQLKSLDLIDVWFSPTQFKGCLG